MFTKNQSLKPKLPLEHQARNEAKINKARWSHGCFHFLLQRTTTQYNHKTTTHRRQLLESVNNISLPIIDDAMLLSLYRLACFKYLHSCFHKYLNSGFERTYHEKMFLSTLQNIISTNPKFKYLEIYPSSFLSKDLSPLQKMVIGIHVPDFLIFGLKHPGYSSVVIELDGDSHIEKYSKDKLYYDHLQELGIFCWSIPNDKVTDESYVTKGLESLYRHRSGALDKQIKKNKREIQCKTIACNLTLQEIESFVEKHFKTALNLRVEASTLFKDPTCPRKIKSELKNLFSLKFQRKAG